MHPSKLCAKDLMNKNVNTITEADSINKAVKIMSDAGVSSLVIERNNDSDAFGIITRKDIMGIYCPINDHSAPESATNNILRYYS